MSSLVEVRDAIVAGLAANPRLANVTVTHHGGDFDLDALKRYSKQCPALVLSLLHFKPELQGGSVVAYCTWGMVALTKNKPNTGTTDFDAPHWTAVIALVDRAVRALAHFFYGYSQSESGRSVSKPSKMGAMNEYQTELDKLGIGMWGMSWEQRIELQDAADEAVYDDLVTVNAKIDTSPRPDGEDLGEVPESEDELTDLHEA